MKPIIAYAIVNRGGLTKIDRWCPIFWQKKEAQALNNQLLDGDGKVVKVCIIEWSDYGMPIKPKEG